VKSDLKNWCITNELALDSREWKLAIHVLEPSVPSFLLPFCQSFFSAPFLFFGLVFYCFFSFFLFGFLLPLVSPSFPPLFCPCFLAHVVSSLAY
jgi:hypothetical protein